MNNTLCSDTFYNDCNNEEFFVLYSQCDNLMALSSEPSIKSKSIRDDIEIVNGVLKCVKSSSVADSYASSTIANTFREFFKHAKGNFGQSSLDPEDLSPRVKNEREPAWRICKNNLEFWLVPDPFRPSISFIMNVFYSAVLSALKIRMFQTEPDFPAPPLVDNKKSTPYIIQQHTHKVNSRVVQLRSLLTLISDVRYYRETGKKHMLPTNTIYSQLLNITELSGKQMIIPRVFFSARSNLFRLNPADNHQHMKQLISPKIDEPESKQIVLALKLKSTRECRLKEVMYGAVKLYDFDGISDTKLTRDNCLSTGCCTFFGPIWLKLTVLTLRRSNMD
ncbi:hypothetical protein HUJ05_011953 [Dendroctonus ponderosae]|nr:hypothetical protein HUJ05_011953 [Dendroctonus ponderosae]